MTASIVSSSLKTARFTFMWPLVSLQGHWPWHGCLEPPNLSDTDTTDEEVDAEPLSLSNPGSDESKSNWGGATHNSHCLWSWSQPHSWWARWGLSLGTSHHSATTGMFPGHEDKSWLWKLNGVEVGGIKWGWPGSLGSICPSVMAWGISYQPSPRFAGLALSWACLPTQLMAPDSINVESCTSPKVSPSPNDCCP